MIEFTFHEVDPLDNKEPLLVWVKSCCSELFETIDHIQYVFCTDSFILDLNRKALDHDYYTDILTFDLRTDLTLPIEAEIYISLDRVRDNAVSYNSTFEHELKRVLIHGLLHISGLNDSTDKEQATMRKTEERFINNL